MTEFIRNLIGNDIWATIAMSFVPLIELKGGIVFARAIGLDFFMALLLAYVGSTIVFFPIYFLLKPVLNLLKKIKWFNKFACKVEKYFEDKAVEALKKQEKTGKKPRISLKTLAVFIFVAIPLPMTGVWTGTAIAVFLGLNFREAVLPVVLGNLVAGLLVSGLAELCLRFFTIEVLDYILYALFGLALILLAIFIIKVAKKKDGIGKGIE